MLGEREVKMENGEKILREAEVLKMLGISRSTLKRWVKSGDFPRPFRLGPPGSRVMGWVYKEIANWLKDRPRV